MALSHDSTFETTFNYERHNELRNHNQHAFVTQLKEYRFSGCQSVNKFGLTFIQQTAREGMLESSLRLVEREAFLTPNSVSATSIQSASVPSVIEDIKKSPHEFARERGHILLADILTVCASDSKAEIENNQNAAYLRLFISNELHGKRKPIKN